MDLETQRQRIIKEFTKQAIPFTQVPNHNNADSNQLVLETLEIQPTDDVLDIACGPGLITSAVAAVAQRVVGIDLTPAMIEQAELRRDQLGLTNLSFQVADVQAIPFPDEHFSKVMTRYSFHHLLQPCAVLAEMVRVCQPGGQVGVIDVYMVSEAQAELYNRMECLRDTSHVRALQLTELIEAFREAGLTDLRTAFYTVDVGLEELLTATGTPADRAEQVREIFRADLLENRLGIGACEREGTIHFAFPIVILVGRKPAV